MCKKYTLTKVNEEKNFSLFEQAIDAEHTSVLWHYLSTYSKSDIVNTCRKLQPEKTLRLLCVIVEKMKTRHSSWNKLLSWFPSLLVDHAGYLAANSNVVSQ